MGKKFSALTQGWEAGKPGFWLGGVAIRLRVLGLGKALGMGRQGCQPCETGGVAASPAVPVAQRVTPDSKSGSMRPRTKVPAARGFPRGTDASETPREELLCPPWSYTRKEQNQGSGRSLSAQLRNQRPGAGVGRALWVTCLGAQDGH